MKSDNLMVPCMGFGVLEVPGSGYLAPFDICMAMAAVNAILLLTLWKENYGDIQVRTSIIHINPCHTYLLVHRP